MVWSGSCQISFVYHPHPTINPPPVYPPTHPPAPQHPRAEELFERELAPFLSESAFKFWSRRLHYFRDGLYYQGGMGGVVAGAQALARGLGMGPGLAAVAQAGSLEEQRAVSGGGEGGGLFMPGTHTL